jgi:signal transduction histidine kinase
VSGGDGLDDATADHLINEFPGCPVGHRAAAILRFLTGDSDDLRELLNSVISLNEAALRYANVKCSVEMDKEYTLQVSKSEIIQILMNLIKNSRDAVVENEIQDGYIDISVDDNDLALVIMVEDNGGGIPDDVIDQIFEPYFTTKSESDGTGIGLYMSKSIIEENLKGTLSVENGEKGARFIITLPRSAIVEEE